MQALTHVKHTERSHLQHLNMHLQKSPPPISSSASQHTSGHQTQLPSHFSHPTLSARCLPLTTATNCRLVPASSPNSSPKTEFATAAKLGALSMRFWDLDDEFEHLVGGWRDSSRWVDGCVRLLGCRAQTGFRDRVPRMVGWLVCV